MDKFKAELPTVVIHCFTGDADEIRAYVARGYYIGITGYLCKGELEKDWNIDPLTWLQPW